MDDEDENYPEFGDSQSSYEEVILVCFLFP